MPLTSCQSSITLAAGAESSKLITSPFIMRVIAINIAPIPINTFATLPACISRCPCLAPPGPILQPDIKPTKRPVEDYHGCAH